MSPKGPWGFVHQPVALLEGGGTLEGGAEWKEVRSLGVCPEGDTGTWPCPVYLCFLTTMR
jgi:hypothetical protein